MMLNSDPNCRKEYDKCDQGLNKKLEQRTFLLFAVLAVPLGLSVERTRSLALPALQGVGILFAFVCFREYGSGLSTQGPLAAALVPWLVITLFFAFGAWRLTRVPQ